MLKITVKYPEVEVDPLKLDVKEDITVGDLRKCLSQRGFMKKQAKYGLKCSGKRKQIPMIDDTKTLSEYGVSDGTVITVEILPGGAVAVEDSDEDAEFDDSYVPSSSAVAPTSSTSSNAYTASDDDVEVVDQESVAETSGDKTNNVDVTLGSKRSRSVQYSSEYRTKKDKDPGSSTPYTVITGELDSLHEKINITTLVRCFLSPDKVTSEDQLGLMTFNMFTSAARYSALQNAHKDVNIEFIRDNHHHKSNNKEMPSSLKIAFKSNKKQYEDICRFYTDEIIIKLMQQVYLTTVTRTRKSTDSCRRMFTAKELSSRAPYILWSIAYMYGKDLYTVEAGIKDLLDTALKDYEAEV